MPFNAPFQEIDRPPNIGQANMNFQSGGQQGFDFSQFPQFGQGYGSALGGGSNGYFGQGFGNSNFGQGFGNFNFGQGFGGQMSGGNYGQPLPPNIAQLSQQNNAPPSLGGGNYNESPSHLWQQPPWSGGIVGGGNYNEPLPQNIAQLSQQNNAPPELDMVQPTQQNIARPFISRAPRSGSYTEVDRG